MLSAIDDGLDVRLACCQSARLVEHDGGDALNLLEHVGALDEDAVAGRETSSNHDSRRSSKAERTRTRNNQSRNTEIEGKLEL